MKKRAFGILAVILSVMLVFSTVAVIIVGAADETDGTATAASYTPTYMFGNDFETKIGDQTSRTNDEFLLTSDINGDNQYLLHRPGIAAENYTENTFKDIWNGTAGRVQGNPQVINLQSFKNTETNTELTYACSTKYVVYDFDFGTETDITDGWYIQILAQRVKSSTSTAISDRALDSNITISLADDEATGNLQIKYADSWVDTGLSIDNAFVHFTVVLDLTQVIATGNPETAVAYVYLNGEYTGISLTGFSENAHYFDMVRSGVNDVETKVTDSVILDNFHARSFGSDYSGNLGSIIADGETSITEFDCTLYGKDYVIPTVRPLAKVKDKIIDTSVKLRAAVSSGDYVRFMRQANYYLPTGVDGVTEYCPADGTLYATFDASGKVMASYTDASSYPSCLTGASYAEIYSDLDVKVTKSPNYASSLNVYLNGNTIYYDATNSTDHFIWAINDKAITYNGPGVIRADSGTNTSGSARSIVYIHQGNGGAVVNFKNLTLEAYSYVFGLRSGTMTLDGCNVSWAGTGTPLATVYGTLDGAATDTSSKFNVKNCNVEFLGEDIWNNYFVLATTGIFNSDMDTLTTNNAVVTVENSTLDLSGANVIHTRTDYNPSGTATCTPTLNLINTDVVGCRRFAPVNVNTTPTFNFVNSRICAPVMEFVQDGTAGVTPIINIENTMLATRPTSITGKINYASGSGLLATNDATYPYIVVNPGASANVTLNSDFNFNLFIPKESYISASVDDVPLTVLGETEAAGVTYVILSYDGIAPAEAGISKIASVVMTNGKCEYVARYSVSIAQYINQVYALSELGYADSVRAVPLMAAIVNYIDNAYTYFGKSDGAENIAALKELLSAEIGSLKAAEIGTEINTVGTVSAYITEAYMAIQSVPKVRFTIKSGYSGTVTVNGAAYEVVDGTYNGNTYIEIDVSAKNVNNTITITVENKTAKYNIAAYYNHLYSNGESGACTLLDALYVYGAEAEVYVAHEYDETLYYNNETSHWHICGDASCRAVVGKAEHSFGDGGVCECGYEWGSDSETGNILYSLGIEQTVKTERDDMKFAKVLNNSTATYSFTAEEAALAEKGDVLLFSFVVKANDVCTPITLNVDVGTVINGQNKSTALTYYAPVQWTRIYMPIENNGMSGVSISCSGSVQIAEAKYENCGAVTLESLNVKSGMWMLDEFESFALQGSDTYLNSANETGSAKAVVLSSDGKYVYSIGDWNTGTFSITSVETGEVVGQLKRLGAELRQLAVTEIEIEGETREYAMITMRAAGACILDITEKTAPFIASSYNTVELATGLYVSGTYAFITNRYHGVEVVDISDPTKPVQRANIYTGGEVQSCVVYNNILYCGVWGECGVYMYDLSELETTSQLTRIGRVICNGKGDGLTVTSIGGRTYIFAATGQHTYGAQAVSKTQIQDLAYGQGNGLDIFDVTDPANPIWISTSKIDGRYYYTGNDFWEAEVSYDETSQKYYAYLVNTYNGVYVFDVTNLAAPVRLAHITLPLTATSSNVLKHDTRAIVTSWDQSAEARSAVGSIAVKYSSIYIAGVSSSVHKLTLDSESNNLFFAAYESSAPQKELVVGDVYADLNTGLDEGCYDFWHENNGQVLGISTYGNYVYVAAGSDGIIVLNKSTLATEHVYEPKKFEGRVGFASSLEIKNGLLYVAEDVGGLGVYKINEQDGSLEEIAGWRYQNTAYVISQVRVSPNGGYAVVHINSDKVAAIPLNGTADNASLGDVIVKSVPGGHLYHRNLSDLIADRYILTWNHVGYMYWIDFNPQDGVDSVPVFTSTTDDAMKTMVNGIASYGDTALFMPAWGNSYRLYSAIGTYTGGYADVKNGDSDTAGEPFSGKPTVCGNYLVLTRHDNGMIYILDISDVTKPNVIHTIDTVGNPDIAYYDAETGVVYIPLGNQGMLTIDLNAAF